MSHTDQVLFDELLSHLQALGRLPSGPETPDAVLAAARSVLDEASDCLCGRLTRAEGAERVAWIKALLQEMDP